MNLPGARPQILKRALADIDDASPAARILRAAAELFYRDGIRAVGVDRLISEANVAKATFYAHFPSKRDLVLAYLKAWSLGWGSWFIESVELMNTAPDRQLLAAFDVLEQLFADAEYHGCAFANALSDIGPDDSGIRQVCVDHKTRIRDHFARLAAHAGLDRPEILAAELMLLVDGAMATAAREQTTDPARLARHIAETLLARHRPTPAT